MEYVSVLAGEKFTDHPKCTHPFIAGVARAINDNVYDNDQRGLLIPLIPRLLVANVHEKSQDEVTAALKRWIAKDYQPLWMHVPPPVSKLFGFMESAADATVITIIGSSSVEQQVQFLSDVLDAFDRIVGRTGPTPEVTKERMTRAVRIVEGEPTMVVPSIVMKVKAVFTASNTAKIEQSFVPMTSVEPAKALIK